MILSGRNREYPALIAAPAFLLTLYVYVDGMIYSADNLHINPIFMGALLREGVLQVVNASARQIALSSSPLFFLLSVHLFIASLPNSRLFRVSTSNKLIVVILLVGHAIIVDIVIGIELGRCIDVV